MKTIQLLAKKYADRRWYDLFSKMHDSRSARRQIMRAYLAGARAQRTLLKETKNESK